MGIIDSFRKNIEKGKEHGTPPPAGHTVGEILNDRTNSHLFGTLLEKDGQKELGQRVREGKLERDDIHLLSEYRIKFSEKIAQSEKIEKLLTEENIIEIARKQLDFAEIIDVVTPKKALRVIRAHLREYVFTDEDKFDAIAEPIEVYDSYKNGGYKDTNDRVEKMCKDMGISQKEYLDAIAIEDPKEKKVALKKLARGGNEGWARTWDIISRKGSRNLKELKGSEELMASSIKELDGYKADIGAMLFLSVSGNDDMRDSLSKELLSENAPVATEKKTGFLDAKKETFNEREFDEEWEAEKIAKSYDTLGEPEQEDIKSAFVERAQNYYREKNIKNKGFWASVFAAWTEEKITNKKNTLK